LLGFRRNKHQMKELLSKLWKDPVWSKVIASGLLLFFSVLGTWFFGLWPKIHKNLLQIWGLATYEVSIQMWLIIISVPLLVFLIPLIRGILPEKEPRFIKYRSDNILDINWLWDWSPPSFHNDKYSIKNLYPRCPKCSSILEINDCSGQLVHCINDECDWSWNHQRSFQKGTTHSSQLDQKVKSVIDRKIHNGEYET